VRADVLQQEQGPSVARRLVHVLTAFRPDDPPLTQAEIARRTAIPRPTVHRLVQELLHAGLLEKDGARLRLGMQLFELGSMAHRQRSLRELAMPALSDLRLSTRLTVHLAVLDGADVVYLEKLSGRDGPPLRSRVGGRMPAHCTGVGKALLAASPALVVRQALAHGLSRRTTRTTIAPGVLLQQLSTAQRDHVAFDHGESHTDVVCVASSALNDDGTPLAAVSVSGWGPRVDLHRVAPMVRTAAAEIARHASARAAG
jgi:IclR family acetate operon transcriptional repressor